MKRFFLVLTILVSFAHASTDTLNINSFISGHGGKFVGGETSNGLTKYVIDCGNSKAAIFEIRYLPVDETGWGTRIPLENEICKKIATTILNGEYRRVQLKTDATQLKLLSFKIEL